MEIKIFLIKSSLKEYRLIETVIELNQNQIFYNNIESIGDIEWQINDNFDYNNFNLWFKLDDNNKNLLYNFYKEINGVNFTYDINNNRYIYFNYYQIKDIPIFNYFINNDFNWFLVCIKLVIKYIIIKNNEKNNLENYKVKIYNWSPNKNAFKFLGKFIFDSKVDFIINNQNNIIKYDIKDKHIFFSDFEKFDNINKDNIVNSNKYFNYDLLKKEYISLIIIEYYCKNCMILDILYTFKNEIICYNCKKEFNKINEQTILLNKLKILQNTGNFIEVYLNVNISNYIDFEKICILEGIKLKINKYSYFIVNNIFSKKLLYNDISINFNDLNYFLKNKKNIIDDIINYIDENMKKKINLIILLILISYSDYNIILNIYNIDRKIAEKIKSKIKCFKYIFLLFSKKVEYVYDIFKLNRSMILFSDIKLKNNNNYNILHIEYLKTSSSEIRQKFVNQKNLETYLSILDSTNIDSKNYKNNNIINTFLFNSLNKLYGEIYDKDKIYNIFSNLVNKNFNSQEKIKKKSIISNNNINKLNINSNNIPNIKPKLEKFKQLSKTKLLNLVYDLLGDRSKQIITKNELKDIFDCYSNSINKHFSNLDNLLCVLNQNGYIIKVGSQQFKIN